MPVSSLISLFGISSRHRLRLHKKKQLRRLLVESLEARNLFAVFTVTSLTDVVDSSNDATVFTLREAINAANASVDDDTIQFAPGLTAGVAPVDIKMTGATFQLNDVSTSGITTINGPGADLLSISGNGTNNGRLFFVNAGANLVLRGLTIKDGRATDPVNALAGGAISSSGSLTVEDCTFENNEAQIDGGSIRNQNNGVLQVFGTTFRGNRAAQDGGALLITNTATTTIVNSTFSDNRAQRNGGAILSGSTGPTTIIHTTIVSNIARSTNGTTGEGGGISGTGSVTLQNTIVAGNRRRLNSPVVASDIVSSAGSGTNIVTGTSSGNLIGDAATAGGLVHGTNGNILGSGGSGVLPLSSILDTTLRDNGGRTLTHALVPTSIAIDQGFFNYVGTGTNVDQRGQLRPRDYPGIANSGNGRDIGAYELREVIYLDSLGTGGSTILGANADDSSGYSVSNAGDVNGDGFDDLIIGANGAGPGSPARIPAGKSYVIFGRASLPASITLSDNLGTAGFTILGQAADDYSGRSVSGAGDVNGDGFDDLIVGADQADSGSPARIDAGKSYVIFGRSSFSATITLSNNLGTAGVTIFGQAADDFSGRSVSGAGDINGDGFDDLIVGADRAAPGSPARSDAGKSYVIFGGSSLPATITLSDNLAATNPGVGGVTILGQAEFDRSGRSVSGAGDVNGDGFDDLIVGADRADPGSPARDLSGRSYVIFGGSALPATITLSDNLASTNPGVSGITISGQAADDYSGHSVSGAGDVNGDGFDDLLVGAYGANAGSPERIDAGKSYVIFGATSLPATITLSDTLSTTNPGVGGFVILGQDDRDYSGRSVSSAGDVNGDGFDDLIIGADFADPGSPARDSAGKSYVIFGASSLPTTLTLSDNPGTAGITILGWDELDFSGRSVSGAGDVNGDGFDDLIVGAFGGDPGSPARDGAGESYILFGGNGFTNSIAAGNLGTNAANTINGTSAAQILNGADNDDILVGNGGADVLLGGRGNDVLAVSDLNFQRIVGGNGNGINNNNDTLRLDGSGLSLDLTTIPDNRIVGIETIDITGSGNNTLTLNHREVLNISNESNILVVRRNAGDTVSIGPGWSQLANETIGSGSFLIYAQGQARLKVQAVGAASVAGRQLFYNRSTSSVFGNGSGNPVNSIDTTKQALLPGQPASFANVSNYVLGLNGILLDIAGVGGLVSVSDFQFAVSSNPNTTAFAATPAVPTVTVLPEAGAGGSTRVKIEFADGAVRNTWLRVTVLANANNGLTLNDVFYFGSAVGEMNVGNLAGPPIILRTNAGDTANVRQNQSPNQNSVGISSLQDLNKDGRVNASDTANVRQNQTPTGSITFFTAPASLQLAGDSSSIDSAFADTSWLEAFQPQSRLSLRERSVKR